ncbi:MAG: phosphate starvation-inducible protein [Pantoea eucrina]|jgi:hypothetical protein|uniref:PsiF family protein n=1 Tax=Pantoea sp. SIMBA_079 TaxID=3085817 RepID=UPI0026ED37C6|nr:PsiF family protein [uncultured Pantoea sp.]MDF2786248.1 phosphate starvation-inducible protein [Pantoea eucrina]
MKCSLLALTGAALLFTVGSAGAAEKTPQQEKMTRCNQLAATQNLKGDERKTFMSDCLKKESKLGNMTPQQLKMKSCNSAAGEKDLSGDARKTFMSTCLKKSA